MSKKSKNPNKIKNSYLDKTNPKEIIHNKNIDRIIKESNFNKTNKEKVDLKHKSNYAGNDFVKDFPILSLISYSVAFAFIYIVVKPVKLIKERK